MALKRPPTGARSHGPSSSIQAVGLSDTRELSLSTVSRDHTMRGVMITAWVLFLVFVMAMLALDLGVFQGQAHEVRRREALT